MKKMRWSFRDVSLRFTPLFYLKKKNNIKLTVNTTRKRESAFFICISYENQTVQLVRIRQIRQVHIKFAFAYR